MEKENKRKLPEISERIEQVYALRNQGKKQKEIAEILIFSIGTIRRDFSFLRQQGVDLESTKPKRKTSPQITQRREQVEELWNEGKTRAEIAAQLSCSIGIVKTDLRHLRQHGVNLEMRQPSGRQSIDIIKRRKHVALLWNQGKTQTEIAKILDEPPGIINLDVNRLRKQGVNLERRQKIKKRQPSAKVRERRNNVQELWNQGKTRAEIAAQLSCSIQIVKTDLRYLRQLEGAKKEKIQKRKISPEIAERLNKFPDLWNTGLSVPDIAKILNTTENVIYQYAHALRKKGVFLEPRKRGSKPNPTIFKS